MHSQCPYLTLQRISAKVLQEMHVQEDVYKRQEEYRNNFEYVTHFYMGVGPYIPNVYVGIMKYVYNGITYYLSLIHI